MLVTEFRFDRSGETLEDMLDMDSDKSLDIMNAYFSGEDDNLSKSDIIAAFTYGLVVALEDRDFVIIKSNKLPTNDFANAIDDMSAGVSTIIQDKKHLLSIPRQIHIRQELGFVENIEYAHLPTILEKDENSKQYLVKWLLQEGYLPDAIINYLLTLGYKTPKKIFYLPDAIEWLDISKFSKQSEFFDIEKLK